MRPPRNVHATLVPRRRIAGFTLVETLSSAAILTFLVFAALGASQAAMRATTSVASMDAADARVANSLTRMRRLLLSASLSTLEAIPIGPDGVAPELMQPGVVYDNMNFRVVTGYASGAPVYLPALGADPWRLWLRGGGNGPGALVLDDSATSTVLLEDVRAATFTLQGKQLSITLRNGRPDAGGESTCELRLTLLVQ